MAPLQQRTHQCLRGHACLITRRKTPLIDVINELTAHFAPFSTKTLGQTSKIISIVELLRMQTPIATWKYSRQINATWNNFEFPPNNNKCHVDLILRGDLALPTDRQSLNSPANSLTDKQSELTGVRRWTDNRSTHRLIRRWTDNRSTHLHATWKTLPLLFALCVHNAIAICWHWIDYLSRELMR